MARPSSPLSIEPHPIGAETRRILALAWPVMLTSLNWTILHVTDVVVVGLVGTEEVAALGASRSLTFVTIVAGLAALSGVLVFTARADGDRVWRFRAGLPHVHKGCRGHSAACLPAVPSRRIDRSDAARDLR